MKNSIKFLGICSLILICLTGCGTQESNNVTDKLNSELAYVEDLIFKIVNKYAKEEYVEEESINWQYIQDDVNKINDSLASIVIDLTDIDVKNADIIEFSSAVNNLLISVADEDEEALIDQLNNMYKKITVFKEAYLDNENEIEKNKTKSEVLSIYNTVNQGDWGTAQTLVESLIESYKELMYNTNYVDENRYNLNKIYILLEEYKVSVQSQNYDLVRMKYITTIENL